MHISAPEKIYTEKQGGIIEDILIVDPAASHYYSVIALEYMLQ